MSAQIEDHIPITLLLLCILLIICLSCNSFLHFAHLFSKQVADNQLQLPIRGECAVPRISLSTPVLEFGDCFVRYPYK